MKVWEAMIRHQDAEPLQIEPVPKSFDPLMDRLFPKLRIAYAKIDQSVSLLVSFLSLFLALVLVQV